MNSVLFHSRVRQTVEEAESGQVREFKADGTAFLRVPGLKELLGVRIGTTQIPLEMTHRFPTNLADPSAMVSFPLPMVALDVDPDGTPVLMRSIQSNDGIWQAGQTVFVRGEWEDTTPVEAPAARGRKSEG